MGEKHESSSGNDAKLTESEALGGELGLAVLTACHRRGSISTAQLAELLTVPEGTLPVLSLEQAGLLDVQRGEWRVTQAGRDHLDSVFLAIQSQLTPDAKEYERRYRVTDPTLPLAANTVWSEAVCINIRVTPEALRPLVPDVFELDLYRGHAFVSITVSRLKHFGAGSLPTFARMNFYQSTYRAHVVYEDFQGARRRGCYFVRSETNSMLMSLTANLLPEFRAHRCGTCPIFMARRGDHLVLTVDSAPDVAGKIVLVLDVTNPRSDMPPTSVFETVEEAKEIIVDFYDAYSYEPAADDIYVLRIDRGPWNFRVCDPIDVYLGYLDGTPFNSADAQLDSIFYFQDVPYRWLPLVKERRRNSGAS